MESLNEAFLSSLLNFVFSHMTESISAYYFSSIRTFYFFKFMPTATAFFSKGKALFSLSRGDLKGKNA
jgi:hypothetical protein